MSFPKLPGEDFINSWYPIVIALTCGLLFGIRNYFRGPQCPSQEKIPKKTVVVTGANSGIGKYIAQELSARGAKVILAVRDVEKGKAAVEDIQLLNKDCELIIKQLDLASFKSIKAFAKEICKEEESIDILVNNAGVICHPQKKTDDENEYNFQVNYLGHFLLTHLLLEKLKKSESARIINNTALAYKISEIDFEDVNHDNREFRAGDAYGQSKLANVLFTRKLAKHLEGTNVTANVYHPGVVNSDGLRHMPFKQNALIKFTFALPLWYLTKSEKDGAQNALYLAVAKEEETVSGKLFVDCAMSTFTENALDDEVVDKLWNLSLSMTGLKK